MALSAVLFPERAFSQFGVTTNSASVDTNVVPNPEATTAAELKKLSVDELMNVEVTSVSRHPEKRVESPAAIEVITGDDIRRSGYSSIPEALRLADNLDVAQGNSHDWHISARGFNTDLANKLLVMMDGRTIYSPLFSGVFWNAQDYLLEDIDRIEVVSGPGGTLWGANAVNGVISIVSKSARDTQGLYTEAGGGNELRDFGGIRYGGMLASNVYYRVYGKYFDRGNEVYANDAPASDSWIMGQGGFRIDAYPSSANTFTLQGDAYGSDVAIPLDGEGKASGGNLLGRWTRTISDDADLSLQLYYDRTELIDPITNPFGTADFLADYLDTFDLDFQNRFALGQRNQIVWGFGYRFTHDIVTPAANLTFDPSTLDHNLFSGFIQDEFTILPNLYFTLGTKLEHNGYTGFEEEPSGRIQWNFATNRLLWAAISRAVRTPSRVDRDIRQPAPPALFLDGNSSFVSESVIAYEIGVRGQVYRKLSGGITGFYNDYQDIRSVNFTPTNIVPLYFGNDVQGYTYGLELAADYQLLESWRLHGGYDLLEEHLGVKPGGVDLDNALNETADPRHQVFLRSSMDLPAHTQFDVGLRWIDKLRVNNAGTVASVPDYFEMDARLAWMPLKWIELSVSGENLLHDHHPEYGVPGPSREEISRSVYGKVACRF